VTESRQRANGVAFPCASLDEALPELRRPPAPAAVRLKLTATNRENTAGQVAAYVDARLVLDRLDLVCGANWHARFEALPERLWPTTKEGEERLLHVRCRLTAFGVTREDVGEGETPKAAVSDALKRAAVHFGVGRALYAMASPWLEKGPGEGQLRTKRRGRLRIDERTERHLRRSYERWLADKGARLFGRPLDHGDEAGAAGFELIEGARERDGGPSAPGSDRQPAATGDRTAAGDDTAAGGRSAEAQVPPSSQAEGAEHVAAHGLRAVTDGGPTPPPATPAERRELRRRQERGGFRDETVKALARLLTGEGIVDRLSSQQVGELGFLLECAARGGISQRSLQTSLTRLAKRQDRVRAAGELRARIVARSNRARAGGRRAA
jgi:hypothetical protein